METKIYVVEVKEVSEDYKNKFQFEVTTPLTNEGVAAIIKMTTAAMSGQTNV
jgi:hypothetical protein